MRLYTIVLLVIAAVSFSSCKKDEDPASSNNTSQYSNKLTLGTGMNATNFTLSGETTTFTRVGGTVPIFYRLESAADLGGAAVSIKIEKQTGGTYTTVVTYPYTNPQAYGHIIMAAFALGDAGSYRATGLLTVAGTVIASVNFTVN